MPGLLLLHACVHKFYAIGCRSRRHVAVVLAVGQMEISRCACPDVCEPLKLLVDNIIMELSCISTLHILSTVTIHDDNETCVLVWTIYCVKIKAQSSAGQDSKVFSAFISRLKVQNATNGIPKCNKFRTIIILIICTHSCIFHANCFISNVLILVTLKTPKIN